MLSHKGCFRNAFIPVSVVDLDLPWNSDGSIRLCVSADLHLLAGLFVEACAEPVVPMVKGIIESAALFFQGVNFVRKLLFIVILV